MRPYALDVTNFGSLYPTWFGQEMTFVISEIRYKRVCHIEVLLYSDLKLFFSGIDWREMDRLEDVQQKYDYFLRMYNKGIEKRAILQSKRKRKSRVA